MKIKDHFLTQEEFEVKEITPGVLQTSPIPQDLGKYYESKNYISHHQEDRSLKTKIYKFFQKHNLKYKKSIIDPLPKTGKTLLDYGCGAGEFLNYIKSDYHVLGYEPNSAARAVVAQKIGKEYIKNNLDEIGENTLDIVTLWHVLEHIPNQEEFLTKLSSKIKKGGKLIIAVPNHKSYDAQYYKSYWAAYDVPRHVYHFSPEGIKNIFTTPIWKLMDIKPLLLDAYYISIISEKYKKNPVFWLKGGIIGAISNFNGSKTGDYSSLIYIIEKL